MHESATADGRSLARSTRPVEERSPEVIASGAIDQALASQAGSVAAPPEAGHIEMTRRARRDALTHNQRSTH